MCWRSSKLVCKNSDDENVPIYKVLGISYGILKAFYHHDFHYTLDFTYKCKVNPERYAPNMYFINEGLHCYSAKCRLIYTYPGILVTCLTKTQRYPNCLYTTAVIVKGYIPPNTDYYINKHNEIVTSKLILTKVYPRVNSMATVTIEQVCDWIRSSSYTDTIKNLTDCTAEDIINDFLEHLTNSENS